MMKDHVELSSGRAERFTLHIRRFNNSRNKEMPVSPRFKKCFVDSEKKSRTLGRKEDRTFSASSNESEGIGGPASAIAIIWSKSLSEDETDDSELGLFN